MIFNSIRARLQLWYGLILVAVLAGFGVTAHQLERGRQLRRVDGELQRRANLLAGMLRPPPRNGGRPGDGLPPATRPGPRPLLGEPDDNRPLDRERQSAPRDFQLPAHLNHLFDDSDTNGFYYAIWRRDGQEMARSVNAPAQIPVPPSSSVPERASLLEAQPSRMRGEFRETSLRTLPGESVLVGRSFAPETRELRLVAVRLAMVGGAVLLLGLAGGWWIAARALQPIAVISTTAGQISGGDLTRRINVAETETELGRLAGVLNATFARLETAFDQQRQFTADAAHELRTPISVMLTQTQTTLTRERTAAEYRETLEACQRAAQRMRRLIESLLTLARLDAGQDALRRTRFDLAQTARECVELVRPLATERGVKLLCENPPIYCVGDVERLTQVLTNLLTNAIQYNRAQGEVRVTLQAQGNFVRLTVADSGVGIAADDQARLFERFFRADKARTGFAGHAGLGLAISQAIVVAHGGTIQVVSAPGTGTTVTVQLPSDTAQACVSGPCLTRADRSLSGLPSDCQ